MEPKERVRDGVVIIFLCLFAGFLAGRFSTTCPTCPEAISAAEASRDVTRQYINTCLKSLKDDGAKLEGK